MKMKPHRIPYLLIMLCSLSTPSLWASHAHIAPLLLQERYLMATLDAPLYGNPSFDLDFSIFNCDFPLLFQAITSETGDVIIDGYVPPSVR